MEKFILFTAILFSLTLLIGCNQTSVQPEETQTVKQEEYVIDKSDMIRDNELIKNITESEISEDEKTGLIHMREEEKLARDVYLSLGEKWNMNIFSNIANSEQTHTNAIKVLLDRYEIQDPVLDDSIGEFTSPVMQKLYKDLISQGNSSLLDALTVGAIVEDLDIKDLEDFLKKTDNEDIIITYNNLIKGSRNHLRAYVKNINRNNGTYTPHYISREQYNAIISSPQERGKAK